MPVKGEKQYPKLEIADCRDILDNLNDLVQCIAPDGHIIYTNSAWRRALGYTEEEVGRLTFLDVLHPRYHAHCCKVFEKLMHSPTEERIECSFVTRAGEEVPLEGSVNSRFQDGAPYYTRGIFRDIVERLKAERLSKQLLESEAAYARTDPLTGLANRRRFHEAIETELSSSRRYRYPLSLLYIDIDNFKSHNDTYGHASGDRVLQTVASSVKNAARKEDTAARYGGDEFLVLLPHAGIDAAFKAAERLKHALDEAVLAEAWDVGFSIGVATASDESDAVALIRAADAAMYQAKRAGKGTISTLDTCSTGT